MAEPDNREWKKGSAELLILSLVESRPRHGYDLARLIEELSGGTLHFNAASLYPLLYKLESSGCIEGRWVEKSSTRRRRLYRITASGRRRLAAQRDSWEAFVSAMGRIIGSNHA